MFFFATNVFVLLVHIYVSAGLLDGFDNARQANIKVTSGHRGRISPLDLPVALAHHGHLPGVVLVYRNLVADIRIAQVLHVLALDHRQVLQLLPRVEARLEVLA